MRKKYTIVIFVFFIGLCSFLFTSFYNEAKLESIKHLNAEQFLHARQAARGIEDFFTNWTKILTILAETDHIKNMDKMGKETIESLYKNNTELIRAVTRVDAKGRIVYTFPYNQDAIGKDISSQKHVREIRATHKPVVSDVFFAVQRYSAIAFQVPVFKDNTYQGTIGINVNFQSLAKRYLEVIKIRKTGYAWVISRDGTELFCPIPGHVGNSVFENCKKFPSILTMADDMLKGHEGTAIYSFDKVRGDTVDIVKKHAVYTPINIGNTFWSIVVASSEDEILSSLESFRNKLIIIIGFILLGGILFSYYGPKAWLIIRAEERRRLAEKALRESEERFRLLFENMVEGVALHEIVRDDTGQAIDYRILDTNPAYTKQTGISRENANNALAGKLYESGEAPYLKEYEEVVNSGKPLLFETYFPPMKKHFSISAMRTKSGQFATVFLDITDRKRAERFLGDVISKNPMSIQILDMEGLTLEVNSAYTLLFGSVPPTGYSIFNDLQLLEKGMGKFFDQLRDGAIVRFPDTYFNAHDSIPEFPDVPAWIRTIGFPLNDSNEKPERFVFMHEDISSRKQAEDSLKASLAEKEVLLREVHHRVKNNLNAITGLVQMQRQSIKDKATARALSQLDSRIRSMAIIHEMFYKSEDLARIDFHEYLLTLISHARMSLGTQVGIHFHVEAKGVEMVLDDAVPCGLIVNELITNAMKYAFPETGTNTNEITVTAACDGISYTLTVADNGIGLPADMDLTATSTLGLYLVRMLGEHQLGGHVAIDGTKGTRVVCTFNSRYKR